jgi:beta-D-xylosidase 4
MRSSYAPALLALSLISSAGAIGPDCVNGPLASNKICDKNASPPERAAALVAAMEDEEKLNNLMRYHPSKHQTQPRN